MIFDEWLKHFVFSIRTHPHLMPVIMLETSCVLVMLVLGLALMVQHVMVGFI